MPGCWSEPTTKDAYRLSWISLTITLVAAFAGFFVWKYADSSLALVFAFENCVDFLSSVVVLWRFFAPSSKVDAELEQKLARREKRASVAISFILIILGIMVISTAANDFKRGAQEELDAAGAVVISIFSTPVFAVLTAFKFHYANKLDSPSLHKDGLCSLLGTVLAASLFITTLMINANSDLEWIDPVIAIFAGFVAIFLGLNAVYVAKCKDNLPIFTLHWWMMSQGDGGDEMSGRPVDAADKGEEVEMSKAKSSDDGDEMVDTEII